MPSSQHQAMVGESDIKGRARYLPTSRRHVVCSAGWRMGPHSTGKDHSRSRAGRSRTYLFMLVIKSVPEPFQRSEIVCFVRPWGGCDDGQRHTVSTGRK